MSLFPSLPEPPSLDDVFRQWPEQVPPLIEYHDRLLRGDSPLSVADRELIAAFVSGRNACVFCHGAHTRTARAFGVEETTLEALVDDIDTAPVDDRLRPILRYIDKLQVLPPRLTPAGAQAVWDAGWDERALYDAVQVAALFHFMNRIIEGTGVVHQWDGPPDEDELRRRRTSTYTDYMHSLGIQAE